VHIRKRLFREPPPKPQHRLNERIRRHEVRVIGPDGNQIGVMTSREALEEARRRGLDLVEIAAEAHPPVCRIMDYGRFQFEQDKKAKEAKKRPQQVEIKEVKLRPNIDDQDFQTKLRMAERFLKKGKHVKVTIMFRRREMRRPENGYKLLERVAEELSDLATVSKPPPAELPGRDLTMVVKPA
jgi:translation initiation factor IF-3